MTDNKGGKLEQSKTNGINFEKAMNDAFCEIFQNLKEIKEDTKKQREKIVDLERRRGSAPAGTIRQTTVALLQERKKEVQRRDRTLSVPVDYD